MLTTNYPLDTATVLEPLSDTQLQSSGGAAYWNFSSAFGGWALALGISAIEQAMPQKGMLASTNAAFLKPLPEEGMVVNLRPLREGRRTSFIRAEFTADAQSKEPIFAADYVFSDLKEKELDYTCPFPADVLEPEQADRLPDAPGPKFLSRYEQRVALGNPFSAQEHPQSAFWVRDTAGRPWDEKALLALSDTPMPRTFFVDPMPRFGATVTYDLQVMCSREEIEAQGDQYLLVEANSDRVYSGRFSQRTRIWSRERKLLAISNQLAFY
ncbi:MAG: thioesterase family protein [Pseudomonadota bacterium]